MNRVFISGTVQTEPEVAYTPTGERIVTFPLWVNEGSLSLNVIYKDLFGIRSFRGSSGKTVIVAGELMKAQGKTRDMVRIKANKIEWMEV